MLKSSVAFFLGASLLGVMLMAQSSQPPQTPSTQQPAASPAQPAPAQEPSPANPAQTESLKKPQRPFRTIIINVPAKKPKELPTGILDAGRPV